MGFSGRLLLVCEVPGPGKAARGLEGGGVVAAPPGFSRSDISPKSPKMATAVIWADLFLTEHSAPGAEVGFSGRLLLVCEVPGPGKAARGSEGGGVIAAPPGFSRSDISLKSPKMATGVIWADLFLTEHSAPGAEVGFSGRLLRVCEVPGPESQPKIVTEILL